MPNKNYSPIYRSEENRILGGVCGGLGEYFNIDPNIIRVIFVLLAVFGGSGFLIYIILWIMLPSKSQGNLGIDHLKEKVKQFAHDFKNSTQTGDKQKSKNLLAFIAVLLGIIFLLQNFGFGDLFNLDKLWPVILIALGISFMSGKSFFAHLLVMIITIVIVFLLLSYFNLDFNFLLNQWIQNLKIK